jgi:hypothetical protein
MPAEIDQIKLLVNQYGMPMIAACGMGYFIYFVWKFVTENINAKLAEARLTMIALIDRVRMLDNDMIRLEQKITTSIELNRNKSLKSVNTEMIYKASEQGKTAPQSITTNEKPKTIHTPVPSSRNSKK